MAQLSESQRVVIARSIGVFADLLQGAVFPAFGPGILSPLNAALDVVVAGLLTYLVGWRWYFVPTFVSELVPVLDLAPTWTVAVFLATGGKGRGGDADVPVITTGSDPRVLPPGRPTDPPPPPADRSDR